MMYAVALLAALTYREELPELLKRYAIFVAVAGTWRVLDILVRT